MNWLVLLFELRYGFSRPKFLPNSRCCQLGYVWSVRLVHVTFAAQKLTERINPAFYPSANSLNVFSGQLNVPRGFVSTKA